MNKPRLIDANKLIMSIANWQQSLSTPDVDMVDKIIWDTLESAIMTIEDQPTAYDIDKVTKELKATAHIPVTDDEECWLLLDETIEIVKGGVNNDT